MIVYIVKCCLQFIVYTGNGSVLVAARLHKLDKYTDITEEVSSSTHTRPSPPHGRKPPPSVQIEISVQRYLSRVGLGAATIDLFAQVYIECVLSLSRMCCRSIYDIEYVLPDQRDLFAQGASVLPVLFA